MKFINPSYPVPATIFITVALILAATHPTAAGSPTTDSVGAVFRVAASGMKIWAGWADQIIYSADAGLIWNRYDTTVGFRPSKISSMLVNDTALWAGTYYDTTTPSGYTYSINGGLFKTAIEGSDWDVIAAPRPSDIGNITYDAAVVRDTIWLANWWCGLVRSIDGGETWQQILFNSVYNDPWDSLHHRVFSVIVDENVIWAGTEGGLNHSTDHGASWEFIRHSDGDSSIAANRVIYLLRRPAAENAEIWAAVWRQAGYGGESGISISSNGGQTWRTALSGRRAWSFHFHDEDVFVPTDSGLWYSGDGGWSFADITGDAVPSDLDLYSVTVTSDSTVWLGTSNGLYCGDYHGQSWDLVDLIALDVDDNNPAAPIHFALGQNYPNPFNPTTIIPVTLERGDYADLTVYDILGRPLQTIFSGRLPPGQHYFRWDALDEAGRPAAAGVYFYRLTTGQYSRARQMILIK